MSKNIKANDTDKNQHLSQSLSDIQDYGPAGEAQSLDDYEDDSYDEDGYSYEDPDQALEDETAFADDEPEYARQTAAAPMERKRSATIILSVALLLMALTAAAGYYFQSRLNRIELHQVELNQIQQQATALRIESVPPALDVAAHTHPENASLALIEQRIANLESQLSELRGSAPLIDSNTNTDTHTDSGDDNSTAPETSASVAPQPSAITAIAAPLGGANEAVTESQTEVANTATPWFVNLGSFQLETVARRWAGKLENPPSPVQVIPVSSNGRTFYRVRVGGFSSRTEAQTWALKLKDQWQLDATWVGDE